MIPTHEAARYMERAHAARFVVFPGYVCYSAVELAGLANGVGPEAWEQWKRDVLGGALAFLHVHIDAAAFMHDCWASLSNDGTRAGFEAWNEALRANIIRDAYLEIAPWRILGRWWARRGAVLAHAFVSGDAGWEAWQAAYRASHEPGPEVMA